MTTSRWNCRRWALPAVCVVVPLCLTGCFTFSSYQSAQILGPGHCQSTVAITRSSFAEDDEAEAGWTLLEIQRRVPLEAGRADGSLNFSLLRADGGGMGLIGGGDIKVGIWPGHVAARLPVSVMAGDASLSTFDFYPTLVGSSLLSRHLEVTSSASRHFLAWSDHESVYSYTVGLGLGKDLQRWSIRPELGWLRWGDAEWSIAQFGIGLQMADSPGAP